MESQIFFSIIIPIHNREKTLENCINSILSQSYHFFEVILVDDHSIDKSVEICQHFVDQDTRVRLILQTDNKHGAQAARNTGIVSSQYDWIMFNDSDDIWVNNKIQKEYEILKKYCLNKKIVIYSDCNTINVNTNEKEYWALPDISEENSYKDLLLTSAPMFQSILCSKKHLTEIDYLDETVPSYQEWDTSIRLAKNGFFVHIKEPLFNYYIGSDDAISKSLSKDFIGRCNILNKFQLEIIKIHSMHIYKSKLSELFINNYKKLSINELSNTNQIVNLFVSNLLNLYGYNYEKKIIRQYKEKLFIHKFILYIKKVFLLPVKTTLKLIHFIHIIRSKTVIPVYTLEDSNSKQYLYQLSFFAELTQYFNAKSCFITRNNTRGKLYYNIDFAFLPLNSLFQDYFTKTIKSPERALIRKAQKNGYYCKLIAYDDYLTDIHEINSSKVERQGESMSSDYIGVLEPRESIVKSVGQEIYTFGCFTQDGQLVAYYMFELFGKNIFHTVKGIGHQDHLSYGIMNFLFAFAVSELFSQFPDGTYSILYGGMSSTGGGLSRFKRNVGCKQGCLFIITPSLRKFCKDLKRFNSKYKIHGDTGLNFVLDYFK